MCRNRPAGRPRTRARHRVQRAAAALGTRIYAIVLMTAFNFFSHGTPGRLSDLPPGTAQVRRAHDRQHRDHLQYRAILGGWVFGIWSQSFGRRRTIIVAALLSIPVAYLWAYSETATMLAIGAFLMQFFVQGAWGVDTGHLNEAVAAGRARHLPRHRLSARQFSSRHTTSCSRPRSRPRATRTTRWRWPAWR